MILYVNKISLSKVKEENPGHKNRINVTELGNTIRFLFSFLPVCPLASLKSFTALKLNETRARTLGKLKNNS